MRFFLLVFLLLSSPSKARCPWDGLAVARVWYRQGPLTFAPIVESDYLKLNRVIQSEAVREKFLNGRTASNSLEELKKAEARTPDKLGSSVAVLVVRANGEQVGLVEFASQTPTARAARGSAWEVAYFMDPAHEGRGLATKSLEATTAYLFGEQNADTIWARTLPDNSASQRVLEKAGFQPEAEILPAIGQYPLIKGTKLFRLRKADWEQSFRPEAPLLVPLKKAVP